MVSQKGKFEILYDKSLGIDNIIRVTSQRFPSAWSPVSSQDNIGLFSLSTSGNYSGETERAYIVQLVQSGASGEAKFKYSNDGGANFLGYDGSNYVTYSGSNGRLVEFSPVPIDRGLSITFGGSESGQVGDRFYFEGEYKYPFDNVHNFFSGKEFRSSADKQDWEAIWDMGSYGFLTGDFLCATGCNVPQITFQANDTDSWANPSVNQTIDFGDSSEIVTGIQQTIIQFGSGDRVQKQYVNRYVKMTSGVANGNVYKVTNSYSNKLYINGGTLVDDGILVGDTFQIFGTDRHKRIPEFTNRFLRLSIASGETSEGYYKMGIFNVGKSMNINRDYQQNGVNRAFIANVETSDSRGGQSQVNSLGGPAETITVNFEFLTENEKREFDSMTSHVKMSQDPMFFIPDTNMSGEVIPVRFSPKRSYTSPVVNRYSETWNLERER